MKKMVMETVEQWKLRTKRQPKTIPTPVKGIRKVGFRKSIQEAVNAATMKAKLRKKAG